MENNDMKQNKPAGGMAGGNFDKEQVGQYIDKAKGMLYGDNFENMIALFKQQGTDGFPEAMGTIVVGVLDKLEEESGEMSNETIVPVGLGLVAILSTDIAEMGVVEDLSADLVQMAIGVVIKEWMTKHEERADLPGAAKQLQGIAAAEKNSGAGMLSEAATQTGMGGI
jgi:hypothetical protein